MAAPQARDIDLWGKALGQLEKKDQEKIRELMPKGNKLEALKYLADSAERAKRRCIDKGWTVWRTSNGKEIKLRHILEKVSTWVSELVKVVDLGVAFDSSGHAAAPWGVIKFIIEGATSSINVFTELGDGIELTCRMISRYAIIEGLYLANDSEVTMQLTEHITKLYVSILSYLAAARKYYKRGTIRQITAGVADLLTNRYESMKNALSESEVDRWLRLADAQLQKVADEKAAKRQIVLKQTLQRLEQPLMRMQIQLSKIEDGLEAQDRRDIFSWLSKIPYKSHFKRNSKGLLQNSGQWLLCSHDFSEWLSCNDSAIFWLTGALGCGKTSIVSSALERLLLDKDTCPIAFFFCSRDTTTPELADPDKILSALVKQLSVSASSEPIRRPVAVEYKKRKEEADDIPNDVESLDTEDGTKLIIELCNDNPAFIIIDALDECDQARLYMLLRSLEQIMIQSKEVVKIFVSSRDDIDIRQHINVSRVIKADIVPERNREDIDRFVEDQVRQLDSAKLLTNTTLSPELRMETIQTLKSGACGMFRWVSASLETLKSPRCKHPQDYKAQLGKLPTELFELYNIIHEEIQRSGTNALRLVNHCLTLVLYGRRLLSIDELIAAVARNTEDFTPLQIINFCRNFLVEDTEQKIFSITHPSVREFLLSRSQYSPVAANLRLLEWCLDEITTASPRTISSSHFYYAAQWWLCHYADIPAEKMDPRVQNKLDRFLFQGSSTDPSQYYELWLEMLSHSWRSHSWRSTPMEERFEQRLWPDPPQTPIILASSWGFVHMMKGMSNRQNFDLDTFCEELHSADLYN